MYGHVVFLTRDALHASATRHTIVDCIGTILATTYHQTFALYNTCRDVNKASTVKAKVKVKVEVEATVARSNHRTKVKPVHSQNFTFR